ncbi:MAG: DUF3078 domain-containing protein [Bacteroidetes bacterium]|nr:DUF3078 domain-containing protein [Bacteroidota bacterium]
MSRLLPILLALLASCQISAQTIAETDSASVLPDTAVGLSIFDTSSAWIYLDQATRDTELWRSGSDKELDALQRLLDHSREPYDSARHYFRTNDFSKIPVHTGDLVMVDSVDVTWINDSTFAIDPQGWNTNLYLREEEHYVYPVAFSTLTLSDSLLDENGLLDTTLFIADTVIVAVIDTAAISALEIKLYSYLKGTITPPLADSVSGRSAHLSADQSEVHYFVPGNTWMADHDSPFYILKGEHHLDSLQQAVNTLLNYTRERDSTLLFINDMYGQKTPYWLTTGSDDATRFWVKNYNNDSITLWLGNPGSNEISLLLEDDINFSRLVREEIHHLPSFLEQPKRTLYEMAMLEPEPRYWDYEMSNLVSFSQTYLSNWTKGGESSFTTIMDVMGKATYNNKDAQTQWINTARLKYGTIWTKEKGNRKNHDQFEVDSKYNRNAWSKIGMSASFYFKSQIDKGFTYPNDSVAVSKFLNPGTITIGIGAEYKPMEKTTINMAPLSYKTTFVFDTAHINQTKHGVDADKWAKRELGLQVVVNNEIKPFKDFSMINKVRLFSNYLYKPQNVDVDWEIILEQKINWFFTIRLNLHMIYDDDVRFKVDKESDKEVAKLQFKEFVGLTLTFKL